MTHKNKIYVCKLIIETSLLVLRADNLRNNVGEHGGSIRMVHAVP